MKAPRRTAAERIAFLISWDLAEMSEVRYQPSKYRIAIYTIGSSYMACPRSESELPKEGFNWKPFGESYGRMVFISEPNPPTKE